MKLTELVKGKSATFEQYRDGLLWYITDDGFAFPVPISDIGEATTVKRVEKASLFMKYIKLQMKELEKDSI